ncbi:hypothetical protein EVAR_10609_1 [Eumeta japonica]|uniref:Uncharacterized protein n=1 Tax=Eumeta variegata TaxID=151549 RepID=A0A4C1U2Q8_EUMVA|nr:hypothetical protein EVAR_10609_1 [Eumeta japonica]
MSQGGGGISAPRRCNLISSVIGEVNGFSVPLRPARRRRRVSETAGLNIAFCSEINEFLRPTYYLQFTRSVMTPIILFPVPLSMLAPLDFYSDRSSSLIPSPISIRTSVLLLICISVTFLFIA